MNSLDRGTDIKLLAYIELKEHPDTGLLRLRLMLTISNDLEYWCERKLHNIYIYGEAKDVIQNMNFRHLIF